MESKEKDIFKALEAAGRDDLVKKLHSGISAAEQEILDQLEIDEEEEPPWDRS